MTERHFVLLSWTAWFKRCLKNDRKNNNLKCICVIPLRDFSDKLEVATRRTSKNQCIRSLELKIGCHQRLQLPQNYLLVNSQLYCEQNSRQCRLFSWSLYPGLLSRDLTDTSQLIHYWMTIERDYVTRINV